MCTISAFIFLNSYPWIFILEYLYSGIVSVDLLQIMKLGFCCTGQEQVAQLGLKFIYLFKYLLLQVQKLF